MAIPEKMTINAHLRDSDQALRLDYLAIVRHLGGVQLPRQFFNFLTAGEQKSGTCHHIAVGIEYLPTIETMRSLDFR